VTTDTKTETPRVLVIAGSDSGGGAGIQADIKTISALGGFATTALTAITAQNTQGVSGIIPLNPQAVVTQAQTVLSDIGADVVKTGMLGDKLLIEAVAEFLSLSCADLPVMVATSGDSLLPNDAIDTLKATLLPGAILTPNAPEAALLTGKDVDGINGQRRAAEILLNAGVSAAIIKGGHIDGRVITDFIATPDDEIFLEHERIPSSSTHGTGCTFASAIACSLAQDLELEEAVKRAQIYVGHAFELAPGLGRGHGPLAHNWPVLYPEIASQIRI
jgi:hydroxymethylpyrimidine/phosphomethylpyrimidine kinase